MVASMRNGQTWAEAVRRRLGRSRRERGERGAVLVEAVIVIPILMMITLGIIEYGSAYQQDAAVAAASRAGARVASAYSKHDFGVSTAAADGGILTASAVAAALQSVGSATPQKVWIYKVGAAGSGPPNFTGCTYCVGYAWNTTTKAFNTTELPGSQSWPLTKQYTCVSPAPDQIAVWVQMTHTAVTHMFGGAKSLTGQTTMRLEPTVDSSTCATS
jgi:Flp pilus assembly protein TadG